LLIKISSVEKLMMKNAMNSLEKQNLSNQQ